MMISCFQSVTTYLNATQTPTNLRKPTITFPRADLFRGRIGTENWHLLKYFFNQLAEASAVNPQSYKPFTFIYTANPHHDTVLD